MMNYPVGDEFVDRFIPNMSPALHAFIAACKGFVPFDFMGEFNFIDLGCSRAKTITINALLYPKASFYGVDFNNDSISHAKDRAKKLDVNNIKFINSPFEDLVDRNLPKFDVITMAGLYTWLTPSARRAVREFIKYKLKDNGLLYLEFAAVPGAIENVVFWKFIREIIPEDIDDNERVEKALELFELFRGRPTKYLLTHRKTMIQVRRYLDGDDDMKRRLLHNVLPKYAFPMYFFEIYDDFSIYGLDFLGRIELELNDPEISLFPSHVPTIAKFKDDIRARETVIDFILDIGEHHDVWCKQFEKDIEGVVEFIDKHFFLIPRQTPDKLVRTIRLPGEHKFELKGDIYDFLFSQGEKPVRLSDCPGFDKDKEFVLKSFYRAAATGEFFICCDESSIINHKEISNELPEKINLDRVNAYLISDAYENLNGTYLVSMATRGAAIQLDPLEVILIKFTYEHGKSKAIREAYAYLHDKDKEIPVKGKLKKAKDVTQEEIKEVAKNLFSSRKAFNLQRLKVVI